MIIGKVGCYNKPCSLACATLIAAAIITDTLLNRLHVVIDIILAIPDEAVTYNHWVKLSDYVQYDFEKN
jgi:hypothetical protein